MRVLSRAWQMLLKGIPEVQSSNRPVSAAEMVLIRLAHAADLPTLDEAMKIAGWRTASGDGATASRPVVSAGAPASAAIGTASRFIGAIWCQRLPPRRRAGVPLRVWSSARCRRKTITPVATAQAEPVADAVPVRSLSDISALADANRDMTFKVLLRRCVRLVRIEPGHLQIALDAGCAEDTSDDLSNKLKTWTEPSLAGLAIAR